MVMRCPHCGNTDRKTIEDNGADCREDRNYLCTKRMPFEDTADEFGEATLEEADLDENGLAICGMQWSPVEYES